MTAKASVGQPPTSEALAPETQESRVDRRKARTDRAILEAARDQFLDRGFHGVRVEDIAAQADVSVGTIYLHFGNKESLYLAVMDEAIATEESYMKPTFEGSIPLFAASAAQLRFYQEQPGYFRMIHFPPFVFNPGEASPIAVRLAERHGALVDSLTEVIERRVGMGILRPMDGRRMAEFFWGAWSGVIALNMRSDNLRLTDDELVAVLAEASRMLNLGILTDEMRDDRGRASIEKILEAEKAARG